VFYLQTSFLGMCTQKKKNQEKRQFCCRKLAKIAENSRHHKINLRYCSNFAYNEDQQNIHSV
jgi:hypothetical protein